MYNIINNEIAACLKAAAGENNYLDADIICNDMSHDERPLYGTVAPEAVIYAESTQQVANVARICAENKIPITTRGAGTGLVGGAVPIKGGVVLCTAKMNKILAYDEDNMTVTVQPGTTLMQLREDVAAHNMRYTPDPGEKTATIGGNAATNAGGSNADKFGSTRDNVISLKAVLASGEIVEFGCAVRKNNSGYNLMHLMLGSEGTLGIITELTLKLRPDVKAHMDFIFPFDTLENCIKAALKLKKSGLEPESLDFIDADIINFISEANGNTPFPTKVGGESVGAFLYAKFTGDNDEAMETLMEKVAEVSDDLMPLDVLVVDDPTQRKEVEETHDALHTCVETYAKLFDESNTAVPSSKIAEYVFALKTAATECNLQIQLFGHASDGNVHVYVYNNQLSQDEFSECATKFMDKNYALCRQLGGAVSAEHGIGMGKAKYMEEMLGDVQLQLQKRIKAAFDPDSILNPCKM